MNQVTVPAYDIPVSGLFYRRMGFTQIVDVPHYARFVCPDGDATFSLQQTDIIKPNTDYVLHFETDRLDDLVQELKAKGFAFCMEPTDQRWLWREAHLRDPYGNLICLFHAGKNRLNPPWRVNLLGAE